MSVFQYFLPGLEPVHVSRWSLQDSPLASVLKDCLRTEQDYGDRIAVSGCTKGPTGTSGSVVCAMPVSGENVERIGYYPDHQTWRSCDDGAFWLGYEPDNRPTPETLRRVIIVDGYEIQLGDEQVWMCPTIREMHGDPRVPRAWGLDDSGEFAEIVLAEYQDDWQMAGEMFDIVFGGEGCTISQAFDYAVKCLAINYRLGRHECSALELITSENYVQISRAAIDGERLDEFIESPEGQAALKVIFGETNNVKKKETEPPEAVNLPPGPKDSDPTIDRAAANSIS